MASREVPAFSYNAAKGGKVMIYRGSRLAMTLVGQKAAAFLAEVSHAGDEEAQLVMARVTGQFKFGNERMGKDAQRRKTPGYRSGR